MISNIRSYIKSKILVVDSSLKENTSAFYRDDIGENLVDRSFQIELNNVANTLRTDYREDSIGCVVSIFGYGYRDELTRYDELMDKALCIRDEILEISNFTGQNIITNIEQIGEVSASQLTGDDNGFKIDLNFTVNTSYIREE